MITSLQNPLIKRLVALRDKTDRDRKQKFIIEGRKEIGYAIEAGIVLEKLIVCPDIYSPSTNTFQIERKTFQNVEWVEVSAQVYAKIAYRDKVEGLLALTRIPQNNITQLNLPSRPLILVLHGLEKPGNLGALLRTADGAGVHAVIVIPAGGVDLYNPNVVRASLGALFTVPTFVLSLDDTLAWFNEKHIRIILTSPDAPRSYTELDYNTPCAIVLGSEKHGLPESLLHHPHTDLVRIPLAGRMDSLNVSCAGAVLLFEAHRQRNNTSSGTASL